MNKFLATLAICLMISSASFAHDSGGNGDGGNSGASAAATAAVAAAIGAATANRGCNVNNDPDSGLGTCFYDVSNVCLTVPSKGRMADGEPCDWKKDSRFLRSR